MSWSMSDILSAVSILVGVITFLIHFVRTKKVETMKEIDKIFELSDELKGKTVRNNYEDYVAYMREVERFAIGVNEKLYYRCMVKRQVSILLCNQYDDFMKDIINQRRKQFKRTSYYQNIEKLIDKIRKHKRWNRKEAHHV